jgi:hypothetical protein
MRAPNGPPSSSTPWTARWGALAEGGDVHVSGHTLLLTPAPAKPLMKPPRVPVLQGNTYSNGSKKATALTWGVFPDKEILQPTIFEPNTFLVWKDESFRLWISLWASIYDDESASAALVHSIYDSFFLVAIIDNDFITNSYMWSIFGELTAEQEGAGENGQHHPQYALP